MVQVVDWLYPQAAARSRGAGGRSGRRALHSRAPGRPQLRRVHAAVREPSHTATPPTPQNLSRCSVTLNQCCHAFVCLPPTESSRRPPPRVNAWGRQRVRPDREFYPFFQLRLLQTCHSAGADGQFSECLLPSGQILPLWGQALKSSFPHSPIEVPGSVFPRKAAGLIWEQRGTPEHRQYLLLPER